METSPNSPVWSLSAFSAQAKHSRSNRLQADSRRSRASWGDAGPDCGSIALLVRALGNFACLSTRLKSRTRTIGRTIRGNVGNFAGRPATTFALSSSERAMCSTTWAGDHFPGARAWVQIDAEFSAIEI